MSNNSRLTVSNSNRIFSTLFLELIDKLALANEDDQIMRPVFPSQQLHNEEAYNLQLLSAIEACWLEIPEMRPNIKRIKTLVNGNLKSK
jgi:hypothetical protein